MHRDGRLAGVLLLALGLRLTAVLWLSDTYPYSDYFYYHEAGRLTAQDWSLWFDGERILKLAKLSWWPPGYPMFLGSVYDLFGVHHRAAVFIQVLLGTLVCGLVHGVGKRAGGERVGLLAALLVALNPTFIVMTNLLASENLFAFWLALGLWLAVRPWRSPRAYALPGVVLGLATLTRAIGLMLPVLVAAWLRRRAHEPSAGEQIGAADSSASRPRDGGDSSVRRRRRGIGRTPWLQSAAWLLGAFAVVLAPWSVRNAIVVGSPALVCHGGGLNFYFGHNDGPLGYRPVSETPMAGLRTPGEIDRRGWQLGLQHLARRPFGFVTRGTAKLIELFDVPSYAMQANNAIRLPKGWREDPELAKQVEAARARQRVKARYLRGVLTDVAAVYSWVILAGGLASGILLWRRLPGALRLIAWLSLYWLAAHVVFWAQPRFRYPLEILLALLTSVALATGIEALRGLRSRSRRRADPPPRTSIRPDSHGGPFESAPA
ncbi:MAG: ArnT family glycosyltransferase [Candidatus Krumholzibacteriia bacterium]